MIVRVIHVTSVVSTVILRSYENTFCAQKTKQKTYTEFIQQFISSASPYSAILESITQNLIV